MIMRPIEIQNILDIYMNLNITRTKSTICLKTKSFIPNLTPVIYSLSSYTSGAGQYKVVYIYGKNFFPNSITQLDFGNNQKYYRNIEYIYYTSNCISFMIPVDGFPGLHNVQIININYRSLEPRLLYSNIETYTLTNQVVEVVV
jgi:hypothetical protein